MTTPLAKETLLTNRVKIMKLCDYFIVSAPLIAKRILPLEKHKEFKLVGAGVVDSKAANNARMDALLEFMDECATPGSLDAFLEGVKNCEGQKSFAKTLKKDSEGTGTVPSGLAAKKKPKTPNGPKKAAPTVPGWAYFDTSPKKGAGPSKPPIKIEANPPEGGKRGKPPPKKAAAGLPLPKKSSPIGPPPPGLEAILAFVARGTALPTQPPPIISLPSTSSTFIPRIPAGSPFKPKALSAKRAAPTKAKPMTFQEVETKQRGASRATTFGFLSPAAVVKTIHFNNKSDLFYEGCPSKVGASWCAKKVQLKGKGKKYVCKEKHENETYRLYPRLYVTFEDGTTHIQTVLFRENVEILAGKTVTEMQAMDDDALKNEFFKAHRKNIPIEVKCKKIAQKDLKKSDGATWDNIATIVLEPEEPASKKTRKSTD